MDTIKGGKKVKFVWTKAENDAFEYLKSRVAQYPILTLLDFIKVFTVEIDASNLSIGAILSQDNKPMAFFSKNLNDAKKTYSTYDLELYDMVQALKKLRHYLLPKEFLVFIDNHALSYLNSQERLSVKHIKWMEQLQAYSFTIKHKKGQENKVDDALSRSIIFLQKIQFQIIGIKALKDLYKYDVDFGEIYQVCTTLMDRYHTIFSEFLIQDELLFKGHQLCIPKCSTRDNIVMEKHYGGLSGHFGIEKTLEAIKRHYHWPKIQHDVKKYVDLCVICQQERVLQLTRGFNNLYQFLLDLGKKYLWTL